MYTGTEREQDTHIHRPSRQVGTYTHTHAHNTFHLARPAAGRALSCSHAHSLTRIHTQSLARPPARWLPLRERAKRSATHIHIDSSSSCLIRRSQQQRRRLTDCTTQTFRIAASLNIVAVAVAAAARVCFFVFFASAPFSSPRNSSK